MNPCWGAVGVWQDTIRQDNMVWTLRVSWRPTPTQQDCKLVEQEATFLLGSVWAQMEAECMTPAKTLKCGAYSWASVGRVIAHMGEDSAPWGIGSEF